MLHCFPIKNCLGFGGSQELKCQELMGVATLEPTTTYVHNTYVHVYITYTQHNQQQQCDVKMITSSNTYCGLLSDIKYL